MSAENPLSWPQRPRNPIAKSLSKRPDPIMTLPLLCKMLGFGILSGWVLVTHHGPLGAALPIFFAAAWALHRGPKWSYTHLVFGLISLIPLWRCNLWTQWFITPLVLIYGFGLCGPQALYKNLGDELLSLPLKIQGLFKSFLSMPKKIPLVFHWKTQNVMPQAKPALLGLLGSLPLVLGFAWLLGSADPVFGNWLWHLLAPDLMTVFRVLVGVLGFFLCLSFTADTETSPINAPILKPNGKTTWDPSLFMGLLSPVCLLFGLFLLFQLSYLFGGPETYGLLTSEAPQRTFVRHGFVQVCITAILVCSLITALMFRLPLSKSKPQSILKGVLLLLTLETLLILGSSAFRLADFINTTGPTLMRYQVALFLFWLALCLLALMPMIFRKTSVKHTLHFSVISGFTLLTLFSASPYETHLVENTRKHFNETGYLFDIKHLHTTLKGDGWKSLNNWQQEWQKARPADTTQKIEGFSKQFMYENSQYLIEKRQLLANQTYWQNCNKAHWAFLAQHP